MTLRTDLCDQLGIEHPIVGAPMGQVALAELAAAISEAGGLGLMGLSSFSPEDIRTEIRAVRERTDRPFGVGLMFPAGVPHADQLEVPDTLPEFLRPLLRRVDGLPRPPARETLSPELNQAQMAVLVEERVPVLSCGLGTPEWAVTAAHEAGAKVLSLVGSVRAARKVDALGADVIVAQGHEAGGHTGPTTTLVLVPEIVDAVAKPVVAAGGIVDGRGIAAALALGAEGVLIGTRFLASPEAVTPDTHKEAIVEMSENRTVVSRCYTGKPSRLIPNGFIDAWAEHQDEILPMPAQTQWLDPLVGPAKRAGMVDIANFPTGQGAGIIDEITPAAAIVRRLVDETRAAVAGLRVTVG